MPLPKVQFFPALENEKFNVVNDSPERVVVWGPHEGDLPQVATVYVPAKERTKFNELVSLFCGLRQATEIWTDEGTEGPTEYKFVSHSKFFEDFDCILDPDVIVETHKMPTATSVLVNSDFFEPLLAVIHTAKKDHRMLVVGKSKAFTHQMFRALPSRTTRVKATGCVVDHPRVTPIPSGTMSQPSESKERPILCYYPPMVPSDTLGQAICKNCTDAFKAKAPGDWLVIEQTDKYKETLEKARFVVCPPIVAMDSPIVWEARNAGATPVVLTGPLDGMYKQFGFLVVSSWEEVSEEFLTKMA